MRMIVFNKIVENLKIPNELNIGFIRMFIIGASFGNILTIYRLINLFDFYFLLDYSSNQVVIYCIIFLWLAVSVLIIIYPNRYLFGILNLIISASLLRGFLTYGIFEATHLCTSWALVFIMLYKNGYENNNDRRLNNASIGLFVTILFFGLIFLHAGYDKLIDPYWQKGVGFLHFIELDWVINDFYRDIFQIPVVSFLGNYAAIIAEIGFVFMFFIPATRRYAVYLYAIIAFQLLYPFNIFLIGYFAVIYIIPMLAVAYGKGQVENMNLLRYFYFGVLGFVAIGFVNSLVNWHRQFQNGLKAPKIELRDIGLIQFQTNAIISSRSSSWDELVDILYLNEIRTPRKFITNRYLRFGPFGLFSSMHTVGSFVYKVEVCTSNDCEVFNYFTDDGKRGMSDGILELNGFQGAMYTFGDLIYKVHNLSSVDFESLFTKKFNSIIRPIAEVSFFDLSSESEFKLFVRPSGESCESKEWKEYINISKGVVTILPIDVSGCDQGRNPYLVNYLKERL